MAEKTVYLVRHCSTTGQEPDAPLTQEGFRQAERLADFLAGFVPERIVSSSYARAFQSVEPLSRTMGLPTEKDDRLVERCLSTEDIPDVHAAIEATLADLDLRLPGGETSREAMARAVAALEDLLAHPASRTVAVTHGNLLTLLLNHFDPTVGIETQRKLTNPDVFRLTCAGEHTSITRVEFGG